MASPSTQFQPDELVVYPAQGVGVIDKIDQQEIGGAQCEFYIVRIVSNNVTLMVPVKTASNVGLRHLISQAQGLAILEDLQADVHQLIYTGQNWNRRFREYSDKLQSTDLAQVASVLKELLLIGRVKDLSFGEKRLQEQAMALVTGELAQVLDQPEEILRERIVACYQPEAPADTETS